MLPKSKSEVEIVEVEALDRLGLNTVSPPLFLKISLLEMLIAFGNECLKIILKNTTRSTRHQYQIIPKTILEF